MKKMDILVYWINDNPDMLACPVCGGELAVVGSCALSCPAGHHFDLAASGYANLLTGAVRPSYGSELFESRRIVHRCGFFDGILRETADVLSCRASAGGAGPFAVVDAGCGEGSQLRGLSDRLRATAGMAVSGIGLDISKDAIRMAARDYPGFLWLVADLARMPLKDGCADCVVNVLSPSNYGEFARILKPGGRLVKVVPGEDYLRELREALYPGGKRRYAGDRVAELFTERFAAEEERRIRASFTVTEELWPHIVAMTPLAWGAGEEKVAAARRMAPASVTLDFLLLVGSKRTGGEED